MKPKVTDWTVVAAGSWNLAILNPDWLAKKVFHTKELNVELLVENFIPRLRFAHGSVIMIPASDRVIFGAREPTDKSVEAAEKAMVALLESLPVTPVAAIGVNFSYLIEDPSPALSKVFQLPDIGALGKQGLVSDETSIKRIFPAKDGFVLEIGATLDKMGNVTISTNHQVLVDNAEAAAKTIAGRTVGFKNVTEDIIRSVYEIVGEN